LDEGSYTLIARGANGAESPHSVSLTSGETKTLDLRNMASPGMESWSQKWTRRDQWYERKGGGFVLYNKPNLTGDIMFTVQLPRGHGLFSAKRRIKWVVGFVDDKNYLLFQLDDKYFYWTRVVNTAKVEYPKIAHNIPADAPYVNLSIQISVARLVHRYSLGDNKWQELHVWDNSTPAPSLNEEKPRSFSEGAFGFYLPGNDSIELSNFSFESQPRR